MARPAAKRVFLPPLQAPALSVEAIQEAVSKTVARREEREAKRKEKQKQAKTRRSAVKSAWTLRARHRPPSRPSKSSPFIVERGLRFKGMVIRPLEATVTPEMVGKTFAVRLGAEFVSVRIVEGMVGHQLGESALSKEKKAAYSA